MPRKKPAKTKKAKAVKPVGRPTVLTPALQKVCIQYAKRGMYVEAIALRAGIARSTLQAALKAGREQNDHAFTPFAVAFDKALATVEGDLQDDIKKAGDADPKLWTAKAFLLDRRFRRRWAQKTQDSNVQELLLTFMRTMMLQVQAVLRRHLPPPEAREVILELGRVADDQFGALGVGGEEDAKEGDDGKRAEVSGAGGSV